MPALSLHTNVPVDEILASDILQQLSLTLARILNKPEKSVMVMLKGSIPICCAGTEETAAYGELVSIGDLGPEENRDLSAAIANILEANLSVPTLRVCIKFQDVKREPYSEDISCLHALHQ